MPMDSLLSAAADERQWFALRIRSRHEKVAATVLQGMGTDIFLPVTKDERAWSDRRKVLDLPLFPGYLFVQLSLIDADIIRIRRAHGVVGIVGNQAGPLPVPAQEIQKIRKLVAVEARSCLHQSFEAGDRVIVVRGPLAGIEGTILRFGSQSTLVIDVDIIQRSVCVTVARRDVVSASGSKRHDEQRLLA